MGISKNVLLSVQRKTREFWLDEFNDFVFLRELSAGEAEEARELAVAAVNEEGVKDMVALGKFEAYLVECGVVDAEGARMLSTADVEALRQASYSLFSKLSTAVAQLSNIGSRKAAVEQAKKNSNKIR
jgi:hypothetical protein